MAKGSRCASPTTRAERLMSLHQHRIELNRRQREPARRGPTGDIEPLNCPQRRAPLSRTSELNAPMASTTGLSATGSLTQVAALEYPDATVRRNVRRLHVAYRYTLPGVATAIFLSRQRHASLTRLVGRSTGFSSARKSRMRRRKRAKCIGWRIDNRFIFLIERRIDHHAGTCI